MRRSDPNHIPIALPAVQWFASRICRADLMDYTTSLATAFETARTQLSRLSREAAQLHEGLQVTDEKSRAIFNALSRLLAMSDQIDLITALMREDVRVIEEIGGESNDFLWPEHLGDSFQQWLRTPHTGTTKIH